MMRLRSQLGKGVLAGLMAGVPQVVLTQIEAGLSDQPRSRADIGPRFVQRVAQQLGTSLSPPLQWLFATAFHFGYAAQWGATYVLLRERGHTPPLAGGLLLAAVIYAAAFSRWGAATQTRTERPPHRRSHRETLVHAIAATSFSLSTAYLYEWLRPRSATEPATAGQTDTAQPEADETAVISAPASALGGTSLAPS